MQGFMDVVEIVRSPLMKLRKVTVKWFDAYTIDEWRSLEDLRTEPFGQECTTTGYLLQSNKNGVIIANTVGTHGDACATMFIPRQMLKKVVTVYDH
jgi:hypothetical protein